MTSWPGVKVPVELSPATRSASASSGTASTTRWAPATTSGIGSHRHARQQGGRTLEARLADGRHAGDDVAGPRQCGAEHGPDAPGADDPDLEAGRSLVRSAHPRHAIAYSPWAWMPVPWRDAWHEALYAAGRRFLRHARWARRPLHDRRARPDRGGARRGAARLWSASTSTCPRSSSTSAQAAASSPPTSSAALEHSGSRHARRARLASETHLRPRVRAPSTSSTGRPGLDERIEWLRSPGGAGLPPELTDLRDALVVAHEWLDVVPVHRGRGRRARAPPARSSSTRSAARSRSVPCSTDADRRWAEAHWPHHHAGRPPRGRPHP